MKSKENSAEKMDAKSKKTFEKVYYETRTGIYYYVLRKVNHKELAEDITTEVFLKLAQSVDIIEARDLNGVKAWLYTVARNKIVDQFRKQGRKYQGVQLDEEVFEIVAVEDGNYLQAEMLEDDTGKMMTAMQDLSKEEKEIILLRFKEDMQFNEIAEVIGKSEGAVKMTLYRSLEKLKEKLMGEINLESA